MRLVSCEASLQCRFGAVGSTARDRSLLREDRRLFKRLAHHENVEIRPRVGIVEELDIVTDSLLGQLVPSLAATLRLLDCIAHGSHLWMIRLRWANVERNGICSTRTFAIIIQKLD